MRSFIKGKNTIGNSIENTFALTLLSMELIFLTF